MKCELISVGTELLLGQTLNTNVRYISRRLADMGIFTYRQITIGDNPQRLKQTLMESSARAEMIILTGGLGPTPDDLTKDVVAEICGQPMQLHQASLDKITEYFTAVGRRITPTNMRQAYFPRGSEVLPNPKGTAPGCITQHEGTAYIMLPGPPFEMENMFEQSVVPWLAARSSGRIVSKYVRMYGIGESAMAEILNELTDLANPTVAPYAQTGECMARLSAYAQDAAEAEELIRPVLGMVEERLGKYIYAVTEDPNDTMAGIAVRKLARAGLTLAVAESCTGGKVADELIAVPGASEIFLEGHITYSNASKIKYLNVPDEILREHGAVSRQTAHAMAEGLRAASGADIAIATTGIAGPGGGTPQKPVGLVYVAAAYGENVFTDKLQLRGDRERIRYGATLKALHCIISAANKLSEEQLV